MDKTTAPKKKTSPAPGEEKDPVSTVQLRSTFIAAALSMGWQLAVVVVIPIVGGFYLDQHLHQSSIWEIVGFVVALLGFVVVVRRQVTDLNEVMKQEDRK